MNVPLHQISGPLTLEQMAIQLDGIETRLLAEVRRQLLAEHPGRNREASDLILGKMLTEQYLGLCLNNGLSSRAANYYIRSIIPMVLALELEQGTEYHKGALFYNTGLACLASGNEDGYEYFLAMTDEEEFRAPDRPGHERGTLNRRDEGLPEQTVMARMQFACNLLNGNVAGHAANYSFLVGNAPITPNDLNDWRKQPIHAPLHQFELLRVIHDIEVFFGHNFPDFPACLDNPYIMLRLAKGLAHLAQWVESCLTHWQTPWTQTPVPKTLSEKLKWDTNFAALATAARGTECFAGNYNCIPDISQELRNLLNDLAAATIPVERQWRLLRILYIVRNATAHVIEPGLDFYTDRALLLNLIQTVFVSVFVICQLKGLQMPQSQGGATGAQGQTQTGGQAHPIGFSGTSGPSDQT